MTEKYIRIYLRRNMFLALFCAAIVCVPLLIVSFLYDVVPYDLGRVQRDLQSAYSLRAKQV